MVPLFISYSLSIPLRLILARGFLVDDVIGGGGEEK